MGWLDAHEYLLMEAVARERVDDLRGALDLALANADAEPICEACKGPMEPIPPGSRGNPRCRQPSSPAASGRMRVMPFLRKRSATRALVASFGQLQ